MGERGEWREEATLLPDMRSIGEKVDEEGERDVDLWVASRGGVARDMEMDMMELREPTWINKIKTKKLCIHDVVGTFPFSEADSARLSVSITLPTGWETQEHDGDVYYKHSESGKTQWTLPTADDAPLNTRGTCTMKTR